MDERGTFASMVSAGLSEQPELVREQLKAGNYPEYNRKLWAQDSFLLEAGEIRLPELGV